MFHTNEVTSSPIAGVSLYTPMMEEDDAVDGDFYLLAKSYFDSREYRRADLFVYCCSYSWLFNEF